MTRRHWKKAALAAVAVAAAGYFSYPYIETAHLWYDVIGIDVSHHQGAIDWPGVAQSGVAFAYMKATEGGDFVDKNFAANWQAAKSAGIPYGAYHFFTQCKPGAEQARNFIAVVPIDAEALPPVLDAEHMGPCKDPLAKFDPPTEIANFLAATETHYGCRPLIYTTPEFERTHLRHAAAAAETYWLRSIFLPPFYKRDTWVLWQYHHAGRRAGIAGPVDLNAFRGSAEEFAAFRRKNVCRGR